MEIPVYGSTRRGSTASISEKSYISSISVFSLVMDEGKPYRIKESDLRPNKENSLGSQTIWSKTLETGDSAGFYQKYTFN